MAIDGSSSVTMAFGSNLEGRVDHLCLAADGLDRSGIRLDRLSSVVETPPIGYSDQPPFLNMVGIASTDLSPQQVLSIFQTLQRDAGRIPGILNGPRTLDLDLLFFDERIIRGPGLTVPHPRWKERSFVVRPLAEIAPDLRDPESGFAVREIAEHWPLVPVDFRVVLTPEEFRRAREERKT